MLDEFYLKTALYDVSDRIACLVVHWAEPADSLRACPFCGADTSACAHFWRTTEKGSTQYAEFTLFKISLPNDGETVYPLDMAIAGNTVVITGLAVPNKNPFVTIPRILVACLPRLPKKDIEKLVKTISSLQPQDWVQFPVPVGNSQD